MSAELDRAAALVAREQARDPRVVDLARLVSIASHAEPELVRAARLALMPTAPASIEADLWFSPLVQARGPTAFVLVPEVAELLRAELAVPERRGELAAARELVAAAHRAHSPFLRLEEEITFNALAGGDATADMERALGVAVRALEATQGAVVARWAARVLPRLPGQARTSEPAAVLARGASERLGGARIRGVALPGGAGPQGWAAALAAAPRTPVGLRFVAEGLELSHPPRGDAASVEVPDTSPLALDLAWPVPSGWSGRREVLEPGAVRVVPLPLGPAVRVRTMAGAEHLLRPALPRAQPVAYVPSTRLRELLSAADELGWTLTATLERDRQGQPTVDAAFFEPPVTPAQLGGERGDDLLDARVPAFLVSSRAVSAMDAWHVDHEWDGAPYALWFDRRMEAEGRALEERARDASEPLATQLRAALLAVDLARPARWLARRDRARPEGMGAMPHGGGTAFRVWAPNAEAVNVVTFDVLGFEGTPLESTTMSSTPMVREPGGVWFADVPGVGPGMHYKFDLRRGEASLWRGDPRARAVTGPGNSVVVDQAFRWSGDAGGSVPALEDLVLYQLHVGTFSGRGGRGTFDAAAERLDHLASLGVTAVQLMPVAECGSSRSWGYDPAYLFAVREEWGGVAGLERFVQAAHERGLAVVVESVFTHAGPFTGLWRFDSFGRGERGGIYFYEDWRGETPWGHRYDFGSPEVRRFLRDNAFMWLEEYRADGLHLPAVAWIAAAGSTREQFLPEAWAFLQELSREIGQRHPGKALLAEGPEPTAALTAPIGRGGAGLHAQWDLTFSRTARAAVAAADDGARDMEALRAAILGPRDGVGLRRVVFTESADEASVHGGGRLPSLIWKGQEEGFHARRRSALAAVLAFTSPGVPLLFQGQELLSTAPSFGEVPLDWARAQRFPGIVNLYRDLIALRRNLNGVSAGLRGEHVDVFHVNPRDKVIAFRRWAGNGGPLNEVVVLANFGHGAYAGYRLGVPQPGTWWMRFTLDDPRYAADFEAHGPRDVYAHARSRDGFGFEAEIPIGAYGAVVLGQDPRTTAVIHPAR